jgi:pimeloyl-ACP methyl ester carboxylesterase
LAQDCADRVDPALLGRMATDDVARDMDLIRAALGEEEISYLGVSYGTLLGATYATLFPQRVRSMVLDAPLDPVRWQQDPLGATAEQTASAERLLQAWFATCRAEGPACPFGDGRPAEAFDALVARLEAAPLEVPPAGPVPAARVDGATVLLAARVAMFRPVVWPVLTAGLVDAENGDGALLNGLATGFIREPDGTPSGFAEANVAVNCLDRAVPSDPAAHSRNAERMAAESPRFGPLTGYSSLACAFWPAQNTDRYLGPYTAAGAPPILVIGGREDSQTPYPWAQAMAQILQTGVLLTRDGIGHGSYGTSGPCINEALDRYLITGQTPAPGTVCPQEPPPTTAPGPTDGPAG